MNLRGRLRRLTAHGSDERKREAAAASDVARYKFLLRVASPRVFDLVHVEVFAQLPVDTREAVYRHMCHDLSEERRPTNSEPTELARAAAWAQDDDPLYLLRVLRRPGGKNGTKTQPARGPRVKATTYGASVLGAVARTAAASPAAAETLLGFDTSVEAAQVAPTFSIPRPDGGADHGAPPPTANG